MPSESDAVYRAEYLAASVLADADVAGTRAALADAARAGTLEAHIRQLAQNRYDEGYERGVHDADAAKILERLLAMQAGAGLLAHAAPARALAMVYWASSADADVRARWQRAAQSLARLTEVYGNRGARSQLAGELARAIARFVEREELAASFEASADEAAAYLVRELANPAPRFVTSGAAAGDRRRAPRRARRAQRARELRRKSAGARRRARRGARPRARVGRGRRRAPVDEARARGRVNRGRRRPRDAGARARDVVGRDRGRRRRPPRAPRAHHRRRDERAPRRADRAPRSLSHEAGSRVRAYRAVKSEIGDRERRRLRLDELKPRVMSTFVRNRLIDQVYLPLVGANLAKQLGAAGANKRTDQMGMLLLVFPPGYGETTSWSTSPRASASRS